MARRTGRSRAADITDFERGVKTITEEIIRSYERVLGRDLSNINPESSVGRDPDGRFEVIRYQVTAHVDPDAVIRRERHRLHLRVLDGPVNLFFLFEEFRDESTPVRFFEAYGGKFGRTKNRESELIDYVMATRVDLQPGDEHEILYECVDQTGPRDLVIFPTRSQPVRLLEIGVWLSPDQAPHARVLEVRGVPPRGAASEAIERQPLPLTANGLAEARFRNPKPPSGCGVLIEKSNVRDEMVSAEELVNLSQPEQGERLRQLRLRHQFDRAQVQRRIGLRNPSMLSRVEAGKRPASARVIQGYVDLSTASLERRRSARPPANVPLIRPTAVHWDVELSEKGIGTVMQEITFECLADGVGELTLGAFSADEIEDAVDTFENLEGGTLELQERQDGQTDFLCRFVPLLRGERHTLRYLVLPERPDTLSRCAEGEERATLSAWYREDREEPTFSIQAVAGVAPEYRIGERLPSRCLTHLTLSRAGYGRHEFPSPAFGTSYGLWLAGLDTPPHSY